MGDSMTTPTLDARVAEVVGEARFNGGVFATKVLDVIEDLQLQIHKSELATCQEEWLNKELEQQIAALTQERDALKSEMTSLNGAMALLVEGGKDLALQISGLLEERDGLKAVLVRIHKGTSDDMVQQLVEDTLGPEQLKKARGAQ